MLDLTSVGSLLPHTIFSDVLRRSQMFSDVLRRSKMQKRRFKRRAERIKEFVTMTAF